ncbi:MAG: hypothetical protein FJ320_11135 [SAR202 cluster bacterium]|nr:hypothetical protein [SAR202 cluster bacterium]
MKPLLLSLLTILSLLLAACTGDAGTTPSPTGRGPSEASPEPVEGPTVTASPTPVIFTPPPATPGGVLTAVVTTDIPHRDFHQTISETLATRGPGISYSRLLRLKDAPSDSQPSLLLECDVCQSWQMLDSKTYVFKLREGVRWQNLAPVRGRRLTAGDIAYSYNRQRTEGWPGAPLLQALDSAQATDDRTLKLTLKRADVDFLLALADGHSKIVAKEAVEASGGLKEGPVVGTGPWIWQSTTRGEGSEFKANPSYFEKDLPFLDRLSFRLITDPETRVAALLGGVVDVLELPSQASQDHKQQLSHLPSFFSKCAGQGAVLAMNASKPPFNDVSRRRALFDHLGVYQESFWKELGFFGVAAIPAIEPSWYPSVGHYQSPKDFGTPVPLTGDTMNVELTVADFGDESIDVARNFEGELRDAGFNPTLRILNPGQYSEQVWQRGDYQIFIGPVPPSSSPNGFLFSVLHSRGQWNILQHQDTELDRLIEAQSTLEYHSPQRAAAVREIHRHLLERAYLVSLPSRPIHWSHQPRVQGFHPNPANSEYFFWARTWVNS